MTITTSVVEFLFDLPTEFSGSNQTPIHPSVGTSLAEFKPLLIELDEEDEEEEEDDDDDDEDDEDNNNNKSQSLLCAPYLVIIVLVWNICRGALRNQSHSTPFICRHSEWIPKDLPNEAATWARAL